MATATLPLRDPQFAQRRSMPPPPSRVRLTAVPRAPEPDRGARGPESPASALWGVIARFLEVQGECEPLRELFTSTGVPLIAVDSGRRIVDANLAARLLLRRPLAQLRRQRLDDLTPPRDARLLDRTCDTLMRLGSVRSTFELLGPDASRLTLSCAAAANLLPGLHIIALAPAAWPTQELPASPAPAAARNGERLTARQRTIMELVAKGATAKVIAHELMLSDTTVRTHVRNAIERLGARNSVHAVAIAVSSGLIDPSR